MHIGYTDHQRALRQEVRAWLREHLPREPLVSFDTPAGFIAHRQWEQRLYDGRWSCITWPKAAGGRAGDLIDWLIFEEEYWAADAPQRVSQNGLTQLGPALMRFGTEAQQQRFLPRIASGEEIWAQAWSEPTAGSDMAAIRCSAERDGEHYVLNGKKSWVARAVWADWVFGLFRSEPASQRHFGLSVMLVPLHQPGVTVQPVRQLNGLAGMAELSFDNVRIPVQQRLGAEGAGWQISATMANFESSFMLRSPARFQHTAQRLVELYRRHQRSVDASIRDAVIKGWMQARAYALLHYHSACRLLSGLPLEVDASANKIFWSELDLRLHETALRILGTGLAWPSGDAMEIDPGRRAEQARWIDGFLFAQAGPIYPGTNEIQRNLVAERLLGIPR